MWPCTHHHSHTLYNFVIIKIFIVLSKGFYVFQRLLVKILLILYICTIGSRVVVYNTDSRVFVVD